MPAAGATPPQKLQQLQATALLPWISHACSQAGRLMHSAGVHTGMRGSGSTGRPCKAPPLLLQLCADPSVHSADALQQSGGEACGCRLLTTNTLSSVLVVPATVLPLICAPFSLFLHTFVVSRSPTSPLSHAAEVAVLRSRLAAAPPPAHNGHPQPSAPASKCSSGGAEEDEESDGDEPAVPSRKKFFKSLSELDPSARRKRKAKFCRALVSLMDLYGINLSYGEQEEGEGGRQTGRKDTERGIGTREENKDRGHSCPS